MALERRARRRAARPPTATARRCSRALESGLVGEDDARRGGAAGACGRSSTLGLFERAVRRRRPRAGAADTAAHRELARTIARKSIVLLKKRRRRCRWLPRSRSIAVIGPNADTARNLFGDYAYPAHVESLRERARQRAERRLSTPGVGGRRDRRRGDHAPSVLDALRDAARLERSRSPRAATSRAARRAGFAEAVDARRAPPTSRSW